ncbi:MAG: T9SS C-terminal target domain-containing protein [Ignavibacteriae bacterium]|nr:MAG: T9SS C-terminal target domain-containing protein [Ignavibacteriota bacterium]
MKYKFRKIFFLSILIVIFFRLSNANADERMIPPYAILDGNNIRAWFYSSGIFDQYLINNNYPGFEWPKGTGQYAVFTAGLSCGAYVQGSLREFMSSFKGELALGYIIDSSGFPKAVSDFRFKIWKVSRTDNHINNPDWLNWGLMIPYGAPYIDVNHNNTYEPLIDTPGVRNASQTIFMCLTDGYPGEHKIGEGFGGGTAPMYAEVRLTAWCYDLPGLQDVQFMKWQVINKNNYLWDSTYFAIISDPDLGFAGDDYVGCDTIRRLGFCYNGDNNDEGSYSYGINPPAVGFKLLHTKNNQNISMSSFISVPSTSSPSPACEKPPYGETLPAYYMMQGIKKDRTPWVVPPGGSASYVTKFCYSGDPETGMGWNEGVPGNPSGCVLNCGGPNSYYGNIVSVNPLGNRFMLLSLGSNLLIINPGDTQIIIAAQLIARGSNYLNSVTKLKQLSDFAQHYYDSVSVIGVNNISYYVPEQYKLYQNYPNPFNPSTKMAFAVTGSPLERGKGGKQVKLVIYDILGKEIATLINEQLKPGTYEAEWNGSNYPSGVYFYSLIINGGIIDTKKLVLLK